MFAFQGRPPSGYISGATLYGHHPILLGAWNCLNQTLAVLRTVFQQVKCFFGTYRGFWRVCVVFLPMQKPV